MESFRLGTTAIADHSFNKDHTFVAVARENNVTLLQRANGKIRPVPGKAGTLRFHDKTVTGVDISCDGRIVTCSQDRNATVWELQQDGTWKPFLVVLRINRAATTVRWSPDGSKFAVGSGARIIAVCYFEAENDWWISKHIKKPIRSTITSVAWHPNNVLLAAGSTDGHARVFSGYIKGIDAKPAPTAWGERLPFQHLCGEFANKTYAWVHDVAFSPSGNSLAYVSHDSSITVVYPSAPDAPPKAVINLDTSFQPFRSLVWTTEDQIVAGGYDCYPIIFGGSESGWKQTGAIDDPKKNKKNSGPASQFDEDGMPTGSALNMFRAMDLKGTTQQPNDDDLLTIHQSPIVTLRPLDEEGGRVTTISSTGGDGQLVIYRV